MDFSKQLQKFQSGNKKEVKKWHEMKKVHVMIFMMIADSFIIPLVTGLTCC